MPPGRLVEVDRLVEQARSGNPRAVARLVSIVEDGQRGGRDRALREIMAALAPHTGAAQVVGLTGAPGVGKSTTTSALIRALREQGRRVGVLAIDPTSPFSGGALLGDRIRMSEHATDTGVFIRSMASRGHLGGLSWATPHAVRVLDAAGFDVVIVETVGVGQSEVEIVGLADTTVVLLAPGLGDGIQAAKAGILEIGDVFIVNKADRPGAHDTVRDLRHMLTLGERTPHRWRPPVIAATATEGTGVDDIVQALHDHQEWLHRSDNLATRRRRRAAREVEAVALEQMRRRLDDASATVGTLAEAVASGTMDPYAAADALVEQLTSSEGQHDDDHRAGGAGRADA